MKKTVIFAGLLSMSFATACNKNASDTETADAVDQDGPMEEAGEWTDDAAEDAGDEMDAAADETKETADEVADDLDGNPETE